MGQTQRSFGVTASDNLAGLLSPLVALQRLLSRFDEQGMIIGGVAASLLGKPRLTADVGVVMLVSTDDLPRLIEAAAQEGFTPRIADAEKFARHNRVLLLRHQDSSIDVDISLGILPFEVEAVERSTLYQIGEVAIRLPTPEDLIIFKAVAHRPKDLMDIQAIIASHPTLDRERIRHWMRQFAQALDMPELWDDIANWL
jgi:hypothetical protein